MRWGGPCCCAAGRSSLQSCSTSTGSPWTCPTASSSSRTFRSWLSAGSCPAWSTSSGRGSGSSKQVSLLVHRSQHINALLGWWPAAAGPSVCSVSAKHVSAASPRQQQVGPCCAHSVHIVCTGGQSAHADCASCHTRVPGPVQWTAASDKTGLHFFCCMQWGCLGTAASDGPEHNSPVVCDGAWRLQLVLVACCTQV